MSCFLKSLVVETRTLNYEGEGFTVTYTSYGSFVCVCASISPEHPKFEEFGDYMDVSYNGIPMACLEAMHYYNEFIKCLTTT